jgi:hypothetical protein
MRAKKEHEIAFQAINALCKEMADKHNLTKLELLAVASNMLGKMIALQDQRYVSPERAMAIVVENMQTGNKQAVNNKALREEILRDAETEGKS